MGKHYCFSIEAVERKFMSTIEMPKSMSKSAPRLANARGLFPAGKRIDFHPKIGSLWPNSRPAAAGIQRRGRQTAMEEHNLGDNSANPSAQNVTCPSVGHAAIPPGHHLPA